MKKLILLAISAVFMLTISGCFNIDTPMFSADTDSNIYSRTHTDVESDGTTMSVETTTVIGVGMKSADNDKIDEVFAKALENIKLVHTEIAKVFKAWVKE